MRLLLTALAAAQVPPRQRRAKAHTADAVTGRPEPGPASARCDTPLACMPTKAEVWAGARVAPREEAEAVAEFAVRQKQVLLPALEFAYRRRCVELRAWANKAPGLNAVAPTTAAFYPFSGNDLLTPACIRPEATQYTLLAEFPPGDPQCFVDEACRGKAEKSASSWFRHAADEMAHDGGRPTITGLMRRYFDEVGILPALALAAELQGLRVVGVVASPGRVALHVARRGPGDATWACAKVEYHGSGMIRNASQLEPVVASVRAPYVTFFKGGPHDLARQPWFADAVANRSAAVVQDESGMRPAALTRAGLRVKPYGGFHRFVTEQEDRYKADADELRAFYARGTSPLPFCFGYCYDRRTGQRETYESTTLTYGIRPPDRAGPARRAPRLVVILALQRSGSSWLTSLVGQHPRVALDRRQESLIDWTAGRRAKQKEADWSPGAYRAALEILHARLVLDAGAADFIGFKLMWDQVTHPGVAADFFRKRDAFVVVIERREKLLQLVSSLQSGREGRYHVHDVNASRPPSSSTRVAPEHAKRFIGHTHTRLAEMRAWAATWASGARGVFYEDLVADPRKGLAEIFREMGLDPSTPLLEGNHGMETFHKVHEGTCAGRISNAAELASKLGSLKTLQCACSDLFPPRVSQPT